MIISFLSRLLADATELFNRWIPWHRLPVFLGVINIYWIRTKLRALNLHDTSKIPSTSGVRYEPADCGENRGRTPTGVCNDLRQPGMGSAGTRFGRNFPLERVHPDEGEALLTPSPRTVSRELMTRHEFVPATILNLLAGAWIQFMVHDWFSHGNNEKENPHQIPLEDGDTWPENPMSIRRTRTDPTRPAGANGNPPTSLNTETHWWDGSQIYGSDLQTEAKVRAGFDGKLRVGSDGLLPTDPRTGIDIAGVSGNWWIGLSMLHNLFTWEHNSICDHLKREHTSWSDQQLFTHARLINAALMAKIHTVEWTPGILKHPTLKTGMRGNWWGLAGERFYRRFGRLGLGDLISGIPGSRTNHHTAPFAMTEEFVSVYRMHPLMPDTFKFHSQADDSLIQERTLPEVAGRQSRSVVQEVSLRNCFYSFGVAHPGAIQLHNYPRFLQFLDRPDGPLIDLAAVDVLRDRERGVPRYNEFRRLIHLPPVATFEALTDNPEWAKEIRRVYDNKINRVDLMVGMYAERPPKGFGFSDTAFRVFILMASRRLKSDRFLTVDYRPEIYTQTGIDWVENNTMGSVLVRHFPELEQQLRHVDNAFAPWPRAKS